ncbi:MAG: hypothetical protein RJA70_3302 [Pseudomonadota bacterium]|jgi:dihydroneopterin aldolase
MDIIGIHGLELQCIVGIRPHEREVEQRVVLDVELGVDTRLAGRTGRILYTVDYDRVATALGAMLRFRRYRLMESGTEELCAMLLATHPQLEHVSLKLEKPGALTGRARGASVKVARARAAYPELDNARGPSSGPVFATEDAVLSMIRVAPKETFSSEMDRQSRGFDWLVQGRLASERTEWSCGELSAADRLGSACWVNPDPVEAVIFRCVVACSA